MHDEAVENCHARRYRGLGDLHSMRGQAVRKSEIPIFALAVANSMAIFPASAIGQDQSTGDQEILVQGQLDEAKQRVEQLSRAITRRPRIDKPIARQYAGICLGVTGLSADFAHVLIGQIEANARWLDIHVLGAGCQVNMVVAFTTDSRREIERLREEKPWFFETLLDYEYKRILRGNGAVQSWQATRVKGADGKEFAAIMIGNPPREVQSNKQAFASNISQQLRVDVEGAIVVFDNAFVAGKSIQQLADYATMRLFAPTDDVSNDGDGNLETILSLFADDGTPPPGLSDFDRAYLGALYKLPPTAGGPAIHNAAWAAYHQARYEKADVDPSE